MKPIKYYPIIGTITFLLINGCNKDNETALKLNNETISVKDLNEYVLTKSTAKINYQGQVVDAPITDTLGYQALEELIAQQILLQVGEEEKLIPTKEDIDKEIEFRKKLNSQFMTDLSKIGFSAPQIEKKIKIDLVRERFLTKGVTVSLADAEDYIKKNPQSFTQPASVRLRWIYLSDPAKKFLVDQELKSGQQFSSVAIKYSADPKVKENQALFPQTVVKSMPPVLQNAISKLQEGQTTSWIKIDPGIACFYVENKTAEQLVKLDDAHKESLRRELAIRKGSSVNNLSQKILTKLKDSKVEVTYPLLQGIWKRLEERLKEANATAGSTSTTTDANKK